MRLSARLLPSHLCDGRQLLFGVVTGGRNKVTAHPDQRAPGGDLRAYLSLRYSSSSSFFSRLASFSETAVEDIGDITGLTGATSLPPCGPTAVVVGGFGGVGVAVAVGQAGADQLLQHGLGDGHDHGRGGRVAEPHGQEHCAAHEAQHQPGPEAEPC